MQLCALHSPALGATSALPRSRAFTGLVARPRSAATQIKLQIKCNAEKTGEKQPTNVKPVDAEWVQEVTQEVLDTSQLGSRGEIWFAGQVVLALAVLFPPGFLRPLLEGAGWLAVAAGLGLVVAGQQALGSNLTPFPKPRESGTLSTDGVMQYVRHPMYGGLLLAAVGFAAATGDELRMLLALAFFLVLDSKATVEEAYLTEKFGEEYERIIKTTKKFIPGIY